MNCALCRHFHDVDKPDGTGQWRCDCEGITLSSFYEQLMDDAEPCQRFYPSEKQKTYKYDDGIWQHTCEPMLSCYDMNWNDVKWVLGSRYIGCVSITFCPWCGTELLPMPMPEGEG